RTKKSAVKLNADQDNIILLTEEQNDSLPKGKSAPRAYATVNNVPCEVILDGGCTTYIIALSFAKKIGIKQLEASDTTCMFGDGKIHKAVGIAKNIVIQVGPSKRISIDALCYDVGDRYDLIIGREGLHALQIGTDWSKHFWYITMERGVVPLNVHYTKDHQRLHVDTDDDGDQAESDVSYESEEEQYIDQDDYEEGYLIMEASDEEDDTYGPELPQEDRLGKLINDIQIQDNIDLEDKKKLLQIIYRYKDCFGTSYDHLSTTNLVKFHVDTGDAKPIFKRPYASMSNSEKETLKKD
ncbi:hypothetical protein, partial, partial [Parasitella parasitica]